MVYTEKFSQFPAGNLTEAVGLSGDVNTRGQQSGSGGGVTEIITQPTGALMVGRWVRFDQGTNLYVHGLADTPQDAEIAGVVLNIISSSQFTLQQSGFIKSGTPGFSGFTVGIYFLSDTMAGEQVLTIPTINGHINKPLFDADSADSGWVICLSRGAIIGSPGPIPSGGGVTDSNFHTVGQPGNTFSIGNWVRVAGDNLYAVSDGTSLAHAQSAGVVTASGDPNFTIQFSGWNSNAVTSAVDALGNPIALVASTVYYLSDVSAGNITPTPPAILSRASKPVFVSESVINGTGWVLPQRPLLEDSTSNNPIVVPVNQIGHGFTSGQVVRVSALNTYELAIADDSDNALAIGFVQVVDADNFILQQIGYCNFFVPPFAPLLPSSVYYLSATVPGEIDLFEPNNAGQYTVPVLIALNATTGYILSQRPLPAIAPVPIGGTGADEFTPNSIIGAGTTDISPLISIVPGPAGTVLTSNGALLPSTFQAVGGSSANVFLGYLNAANNFSDANIFTNNGGPFNSYFILVERGNNLVVYGINGTSAGPNVSVGFQFYMNGAWSTGFTYGVIGGGYKTVSNTGVATAWGMAYTGSPPHTADSLYILPPTSRNVSLNSGYGYITTGGAYVGMNFNMFASDYSNLPVSATAYSSVGFADDAYTGLVTGLRIFFDNGVLTPGSGARIAVYGIPNA